MCKRQGKITQLGITECKGPFCQKYTTFCMDHESKNLSENPQFRMSTVIARKHNEKFMVDIEKIFNKIIKDIPPVVSFLKTNKKTSSGSTTFILHKTDKPITGNSKANLEK